MPRTPLRIMELLRAGQLKAAAEVVEREAMLVFDLRGKRPGYTNCGNQRGDHALWPRGRAAAPTPRSARRADREELRRLLRQEF